MNNKQNKIFILGLLGLILTCIGFTLALCILFFNAFHGYFWHIIGMLMIAGTVCGIVALASHCETKTKLIKLGRVFSIIAIALNVLFIMIFIAMFIVLIIGIEQMHI